MTTRLRDKSFHVGDWVLSARFGRGQIVDQWRAFPITDCHGHVMMSAGKKGIIDATDVYEVQFAQHIGRRSVNVCRLLPL